MDKDDIVSLLRSDVPEFNRLRQDDPELGPGLDLSGAQLAGVDLTKADLGRVNLSGANLQGTNLSEAALGSVILETSDLTNANLAGANLHRARLAGAKFQGANVEKFSGNCRICLHSTNLKDVHWDKEQIEAMLEVLNQNPDWAVRYEVVPK